MPDLQKSTQDVLELAVIMRGHSGLDLWPPTPDQFIPEHGNLYRVLRPFASRTCSLCCCVCVLFCVLSLQVTSGWCSATWADLAGPVGG